MSDYSTSDTNTTIEESGGSGKSNKKKCRMRIFLPLVRWLSKRHAIVCCILWTELILSILLVVTSTYAILEVIQGKYHIGTSVPLIVLIFLFLPLMRLRLWIRGEVEKE